MSYSAQWTRNAVKQASKLPQADRARVIAAVGRLREWPNCAQDIKPLQGHAHQYRLRCGRYRVLFDVEAEIRVVRVEQVRKRDDRTY